MSLRPLEVACVSARKVAQRAYSGWMRSSDGPTSGISSAWSFWKSERLMTQANFSRQGGLGGEEALEAVDEELLAVVADDFVGLVFDGLDDDDQRVLTCFQLDGGVAGDGGGHLVGHGLHVVGGEEGGFTVLADGLGGTACEANAKRTTQNTKRAERRTG